MKRYRKKPIIVEAEKWHKMGDVPEAPIKKFVGYREGLKCQHCGLVLKQHGLCATLEGEHIVCPGDYIIKGIKGEFYPCKPDIFKESYEPVRDDEVGKEVYEPDFVAGVAYAAAQIIRLHDKPTVAMDIIRESGIPLSDFYVASEYDLEPLRELFPNLPKGLE